MSQKTPELPVTIIGGYLGCGKTTLVNHLLRHANGLRLAILVNDFGDLPIDADLIEAQDGDVISLSGGCICCSYGDDLSLSLRKLQSASVKPEHILIEASGVALPGAIGNSLSLLQDYRLDCIAVLADASAIMHQANEKYIGDTVLRQLADADLLVLNKLDLTTQKKLTTTRGWLAGVSGHAPVVEAVHGKIEAGILFHQVAEYRTLVNPSTSICPPGRAELSEDGCDVDKADIAQKILRDHNHASELFESMHLLIGWKVDAHIIAAELADQKMRLIRVKGFVRNLDNELMLIQIVGARWSVTDAPSNLPESTQPGLVFIAKAGELKNEQLRRICKRRH